MRYKRITALLLSLVMTALLCSCGNADSKQYIAVIVKSVNSDFFVNMQKGVESAATEYNVTVTFEGPENEEDYVTQNLLIDAAVKNGADAILLSAINYEKSAEAVNSAARKGVKVIAIDSAVNSQSVSLFIQRRKFPVCKPFYRHRQQGGGQNRRQSRLRGLFENDRYKYRRAQLF